MSPTKMGSGDKAGLREKRHPIAAEVQSLERSLPLTWNAFEAAFKRGGCPICQILRGCEERSLFSFLYEGMMNPHVRQKFLDGGGFCARHFWAATHLGINFWSVGAFEVANLCVSLVARADKETSRAAELQSRSRPSLLWNRKRKSRAMPPGQDCIFCRELRGKEQSLTQVLEQLVGEEEFAGQIATHGLCLQHLQEAILEWKQTAKRAWLVEIARQRIAELTHDLREFIRKHEHRYRHEAFGREADVVRRAMEFLIGFDSQLPGGKLDRENR